MRASVVALMHAVVVPANDYVMKISAKNKSSQTTVTLQYLEENIDLGAGVERPHDGGGKRLLNDQPHLC